MDNTQKARRHTGISSQRAISTVILSLVALLVSATFVFASDVSSALWRGVITITNEGDTTATSVSVNMSLSSPMMVGNGYASANLSDTSIQINGVDTAFMPGANASYPWVVFVPSIGAGQNLIYDLFSSGATGGKLCYFPGPGGMTATDSAGLELGDNFSIEQSGWVDTIYSVNKTLTYKQDAFQTFIGAEGAITSYISGDDEELSENYTTGADAYDSIYDTYWLAQTFTPSTSHISANVTILAYRVNNPGIFTVAIKAVDGSGHPTGDDLCSGTSDGDTLTTNSAGEWRDVTMAPQFVLLESGTQYALVVSNPDAGANYVRWIMDETSPTYGGGNIEASTDSGSTWASGNTSDHLFREWGLNDFVAATGVSSEEYTVRTWADTSYLHISIDGVESDNVSLNGASVPDNSENWSFMQGIPYMERHQIWVDGVLQQDIVWEYTAGNFTDQSGNNHNTIPTFRTTSSDADVSAVLSSFEPTEEAQLSTFSLVSSYAILTENATLPTGTYDELDVSRIPGGAAANELLAEGEIPQAAWWYPFLFIGICVIGMLMYGATTLKRSTVGGRLVEGQIDGSLLFMFIVMEITLVVLGVMGVIPKWPFIIFPIAGIAIILSRKHYSWG